MKAAFGNMVLGTFGLQLLCSLVAVCFVMISIYVVVIDAGASLSVMSENFTSFTELMNS